MLLDCSSLDTLHLIESSHMWYFNTLLRVSDSMFDGKSLSYYYLIQNYSNPKSLLSGTW